MATREDFINQKNKAVYEILGMLERQGLDPLTYNELRKAIRYHFNALLNSMFKYMHIEQVPLKREDKANATDGIKS